MIFFETPDGGPRWKHIKPHFANIPPDKRQAEMDKFCLQYAPWFFELLTEVDPDTPTVLEEFQIEYLLDTDSRFKITNKTRQAGGSLVVSMAKFWKCYRNEATNCDIVSVNLEEAQGKITYIRNLWETLPTRWRHPIYPDNTTSIGFHGRGNRQSVIRSKAASSGVRGGRKDIVFDEAHHLPNFKEITNGMALRAFCTTFGVSATREYQGKSHEYLALTPRKDTQPHLYWNNQVHQ